MLLLVLGVSGVLAGLTAGLLGVGGGIVMVPALLFSLGWLGIDETWRMHVAIATSLTVIVPTSLISAQAHAKRGAVDFKTAVRMMPGAAIGAMAAAYLAKPISGDWLAIGFIAIALFVATKMWRSANAEIGETKQGLKAGPESANLIGDNERLALGVFAAPVGLFSTWMGIAGGTLLVPLFNQYRLPIQRAIGTSSLVGVAIALPGAAGFLLVETPDTLSPLRMQVGFVHLGAVLALLPGTIIGAPAGARLAHALRGPTLFRIFAVILVIIAVRLSSDILLA
ncbi:MAG: sulfite exporter TauE/SafE family protein [Pseudomonadota bacterium]